MTTSDVTASAPSAATSPADRWLGTGVRFPMRVVDGRIGWIDGMDLVRQSIETILDTEPGERVMLPTFGCGLRRYLMAPNTVATRTAMQQDITTALSAWEPRIRLTEVAVTPAEHPTQVWVSISYVRLADLRPDNLVYPFYLR
ncbi:GPW/gp25 family protein [Georgenia sp. 10Sc9-8]|uniref:GPW/gp25 family protein n=1 Tax=Georgenia halotolerans TaxID=3028317 RepID=A0ABT5TYX8_9MICO|nr:GPW/gp25 family protein [Georgenia halotolerans]